MVLSYFDLFNRNLHFQPLLDRDLDLHSDLREGEIQLCSIRAWRVQVQHRSRKSNSHHLFMKVQLQTLRTRKIFSSWCKQVRTSFWLATGKRCNHKFWKRMEDLQPRLMPVILHVRNHVLRLPSQTSLQLLPLQNPRSQPLPHSMLASPMASSRPNAQRHQGNYHGCQNGIRSRLVHQPLRRIPPRFIR